MIDWPLRIDINRNWSIEIFGDYSMGIEHNLSNKKNPYSTCYTVVKNDNGVYDDDWVAGKCKCGKRFPRISNRLLKKYEFMARVLSL